MMERIFGVTQYTTAGLKTVLVYMLVAAVLGLIISGIYLIVSRKAQRSASFFLSLVMIPSVVAVVILLIGNNIAGAFSIAGIFALVRYRSIPGDGKDIAFVFMSMAAGLACGLGLLTLGFIVVLVLSVVVLAVSFLGKYLAGREGKRLRILIPEDMDYQGAFDDLFETYTTGVSLERVKTTNMGTLYELTYAVYLKKGINEKQFLDEIRCRNGNLTVILSKQEMTQSL